ELASKRARKFPITWGEEEDTAFNQLKSELASPTVLAFPDPNRPFELHTDASQVGSGAVLMQNMGGAPRVIAFASHRFSRTDARRGPTERECMGVLWAVQHFRPYVMGRKFTLVTDCSALTWLFRSRDLCPNLHRWALRLMEYDMTLEWRAGTNMALPDALSRLPHAPEPGADIDDSFSDDGTSASPEQFVGPRGPSLEGVLLADLEANAIHDTDQTPAADVVHPITYSEHITALTSSFPFAACESLPAETPRRSRRLPYPLCSTEASESVSVASTLDLPHVSPS
ncbi:unnamed protein product, partial [Pylaiella littoralis]